MIRSSSVWRWQLVFTATLLTLAVLIAAFSPQVYGSGMYLAGLCLVIVVTLAVFVIPWERVPRWTVVLVPYLDILAIGFTTSITDVRLAYLWVFPVTWIATYYSMAHVLGSIGLISVCFLLFGNYTGIASDILMRVLIVALTLGFMATSIRIGVQRSRASHRLLRRQSLQVNRMAARAETHQRRATQIIDALDTALVSVSGDGLVLHMNDAYRHLFGAGPSPAVQYDDLQGEPVPIECTVLARAARAEVMRAERIWVFDSAGVWRVLEATTVPIASIVDAQPATLLILDDITVRLAAEKERQMMTAIVSHELRNPLTAILGHVDLLLERDDLPPDVARQLAVVSNASERMHRLVTTTLDESSRDGVLLAEPVDLRQVADASVSSFLPSAAEKHQTIGIVGVDTLAISGDAFRLRQAFDNLLSNAVKYTGEGGEITVRLGPGPEGTADVEVSDTGAGMHPDDVQRIFQPYFRTDEAVRSGVPGTGLGMLIVRDIVTAHGGALDVHSEQGVGTRVSLRFPPRPVKRENA